MNTKPESRRSPTPFQQRVPNALTASRLALAAAFFALLTCAPPRSPAALVIAAAVFITAALTDAADGFLARRWNAITAWGRVMDPFADKVLVLGAFIFLASPAFAIPAAPNAPHHHAAGVAPWMVVVILARELLVTSIRGVYEARGVDFSADRAGKAKMIVQSAAVPALLLIVAFADTAPGTPGSRATRVIALAAVAVTALSGVTYVAKALRAGPER